MLRQFEMVIIGTFELNKLCDPTKPIVSTRANSNKL